jgi:hypothetical protein
MSRVIVSPIARPRDAHERSTRIGGGGEDHPHEEEGQDRLDRHAGSSADAGAERRDAEVDAVHLPLRQEPGQRKGCQHGRDELREPVGRRQLGLDPPRDEEAKGHGRVEVAAGDVAHGGGHDGDHQPVGQPDRGQIMAARRDD